MDPSPAADSTVKNTSTDQTVTNATSQSGIGGTKSDDTKEGKAPNIEEQNVSTHEGAPQTVDETLGKINRAFKERATIQRAKELGFSYVNVSVTPINPDLLKLIAPEQAKNALLIPFFKIGKRIRVAVFDPNAPETQKVLNELKNAGYEVNINIASDDAILQACKLYETSQYKVKKEITTSLSEEKIKAYEQEILELTSLQKRLPNLNSEEAVYLINIGALKTGASDIHYEPEEKFIRVRFRIDGVLHKIFDIEKSTYTNILNQIKYQSKMKLNINNEPQDGRYSFLVNNRQVDVRTSVLPTQFGETLVCRLLDSDRHLIDFQELGFFDENLQKAQHLTELSHGMILITGPTGSGKTTTLYTLLEKFNRPEAKIITLEDPIEYHLEGISQSQINEKRGYDFANGLRAILRQDPDVIMLGEIRDIEAAETAAQAALTGHVMLSTLHTNSAIETIPRLVNIGLPPFMIAPALHTIIAQRLVRKICSNCQEMRTLPTAEREEIERMVEGIKHVKPLENITIPDVLPLGKGCTICSHTGYKGRIAIIEMLSVDFELKDLILNKASSTKMIEAMRRKGMLTLREDGILKVLKGLTTLEEVHRVTALNV